MELPRVVYENLPYGYFLASGALFSLGDSWPLLFSGAVFYLAACIVLVQRSAHRRRDKYKHKQKRVWLPELIYEFLPYAFSAVGILLLMISNSNIVQFIAFSLMIWAIRNLICRHNNRTRKQGLF
ncbi:hypothetical protein [Thalassotalea marina]|uniref:Uncharacterized protein n=1 Tax=Thalassotalea marina TaxID=1673741 RepID=A0A919BNY4_9GAMM|nr:hypothetical protein [Thalassotalea marina]GHG01990.1 hypothetical protein GCM10017161_33510 [Thalassotalea marina]